jgi:hypothetical protein
MGRACPLPFDHLVPRPITQIAHAITIHAPSDEVWGAHHSLDRGSGILDQI